MLLILLLTIFIGITTYYVIQRSVARFTTTPLWLYWLVLMMPALVMLAWFAVMGQNQPIPPLLLLGLFILCPMLYFWLIQKGRIDQNSSQGDSRPTQPGQLDLSLDLSNVMTTAILSKDSSTPAQARPISTDEEKSLRDCFPWGVYYLQKLDYFPQAILCRGKLRTNPDVAYQTIKENVEGLFGDRFLIIFQESLQGQPFFALVPNSSQQSSTQPNSSQPNSSQPNSTQPNSTQPNNEPAHPSASTANLTRPGLALALMLLTLVTTTLMGVEMAGLSAKELQENSSLFLRGLPYGLGVMAILGFHELSHYLTAIRYKIRTTLPYFIPIPFFLGTFGAFIQIKSPIPHRKALFDVAIAGPLGGFVVAVPLLVWGLKLSGVVQLPPDNHLLNFQALDPRFSFLMTLLSKIALGDEFVVGKALLLHPLAIAGYIGLIITALNLMPIGQLDGGHIIHAVFGQRTAIVVGYVTRVVMLCLAFLRPEFLLWAILLFLIPVTDQPALNDVTELDNRRDILGLSAMVLLVLILLPVPGAIAQWLHV